MRYSILCGILLFSVIGCTNKKIVSEKQIISVSILPQKYFVEQIVEDFFEVNVLIPPGASPASYDPTPQQIADLEISIAYFKIGHIGFEKSWMDRITSVNPEMYLADLSKGVDLIRGADILHGDHSHEGGVDPHIWVSPKRVKIIVENIYKAAIEIDPVREKIYSDNYKSFLEKLDSLDTMIEQMLKEYKGRSFLIFHPALTYFAADYEIEQIPIELEGKEPAPGYLIELIDHGKEENIKVIFVQQQFDMDNARAIADELDGKVVQINPLDEDWIISVNHIVNSLVDSYREK